MAEENLTLIASVEEDFRDPLDELSGKLLEVGSLAEEVFPIDVDATGVESTLAELEAIDEQVESIDDNVTVDTDVDSSVAAEADRATSVATPDGGDRGGFLDLPDIRRARDVYSDAFDENALFDFGGELTRKSQLIEGGLSDHIDSDRFMRSLFDSESSISLGDLADIEAGSLSAWNKLDREGLLKDDGGLLSTFRDVSPQMSDLYTVIASLVPLLVVFVGAMPAAIAAVGGLAMAAAGAAGALAGIAGLSVLGLGMENGQFDMSNITDKLEELRDSFLEAFGPLAERLQPLAEEAFTGIERLFTALAAEGDALMRLRQEARALGGFILDVVPQMVSSLLTLADVASPIFGAFGDWIKETDFIAIFANVLGRALPHLYQFASAIVSMLPVLIDLSMGFLWVASSLTTFVGYFATLVDLIPGGAMLLGVLAATALTLYGAFALANMATQLYSNILSLLFVNASSLTGALSTLTTMIANQGIVSGLTAFATQELALSLSSLFSILSLGLMAGTMLVMIDRLTSMRDRLGEVTGQLKNFKSVAKGMSGPSADISMGSTGGRSGPTYTSFTDNRQFQINANSRDNANRAAQSMAFNSSYSQGKNTDTQFTTQ